MANPIHEIRYQIFRGMLLQARLDQALLQSQLAERLERPQSFVSKYERGDRRLDMPEFLEVADALGIDVTAFIFAYREEATKLEQMSSLNKKIAQDFVSHSSPHTDEP